MQATGRPIARPPPRPAPAPDTSPCGAPCPAIDPSTQSSDPERRNEMSSKQDQQIAVVGMAVRFPEAPTLDAYWANLIAGRCSVQRFSKEAAIADGVPRSEAERDDYVPASALVDGVDRFDAGFFGFSRREAEVMDPQYRLFLETGWAALEAAGQTGRRRSDSIGVFATSGMSLYSGKEMNTYYRVNVAHHDELLDTIDAIQIKVLNDKDYLPTQLSYRLNLKGPSMAVQTACSSALVALQLAVQSLRRGECDVALVGASAIHAPRHAGYRYSEGSIYSSQGVCRPFEQHAAGIVGGNGVGVVVLRRRDCALRDNDRVHALIQGIAVNNDGANKVSYAAPSIEGQKANIRAALRDAGISPALIGMVDAHGTGTAMGDPIEVAALAQVFGEAKMAPASCAIGSVKSNIGHLDTAAGMASLVKAILAVEHAVIPPTAGFVAPNPLLNLARTPFYVNAQAQEWPAADGPRRALVCATGAGGTNAHVVLASCTGQDGVPAAPRGKGGEAQEAQGADDAARLLPLSAKDEASLRAQARQYAALLRTDTASLRDICYTAATRREHFRWRLAAVGQSRRQLAEALDAIADGGGASRDVALGQVKGRAPRPVFVFTGQGAQYPGMGAELYERHAAFRAAIDRCEALYLARRGTSLKALMWQGDEAALARTEHTQPALFALEYALAQLWRSWGIEPAAVIGHSVGEYVAAHVAGVFSLEDAFGLLLLRSELMGALPAGGAMLALQGPAPRLAALCGQLPAGLEVAAFNSPEALVVAGPQDAIEALARQCDGDGIVPRQLPVSHAFHSAAMAPVLTALTAGAASLRLQAPALPLVSNVSGELAGAELALPGYWAQQVRQPVRFEQGVQALARAGHTLFLELGPRPVLSHFVRAAGNQLTPLPSLAPGKALATLAGTLAALHVRGADIAWQDVLAHEPARPTPLPAYPFNRAHYWAIDLETNHMSFNTTHSEPAESPRNDARKADIVTALGAMFAELLGQPGTALDDSIPLMQLGADSFVMTAAIKRIHDTWQVKLSMRELFERYLTIGSIAERLLESPAPAQAGVAAPPSRPAVPASTPAAIPASIPVAVTMPPTDAAVLHRLKAMFAELLGQPGADLDEDAPLMQLGADSFVMTAAIKRIADTWGVKLSMREMFEQYLTIASIAGRLGNVPAGRPVPAAPEPAPATAAPLAAPRFVTPRRPRR